MIEEDDNIYVLEDVEEEDPEDNSPLNFAAYDDEERERSDQEDLQQSGKARSAFGLLFKIMFNPVEGWKELRRSNTSVEKLQSGCFYPLLSLLALSNFADYFYSVNVNLSAVLTKAVVSFVAFFFGYFCIQMVLQWFLPKDMREKFDSKFGKAYTVISLATLALFSILTELLPMIWPILIFLPLWTFYLMFKGVRFFKFHQNEEMKFFVMSAAAMAGIPYLIDQALNAALHI